jgi:hypothetical protein
MKLRPSAALTQLVLRSAYPVVAMRHRKSSFLDVVRISCLVLEVDGAPRQVDRLQRTLRI